ncbi:MAG: tetratricopeptide repeat protein [Nitrospirales bacterium]
MNRTTRRRANKNHKQPGGGKLSAELHSVFSQAVAHHQALQFAKAEKLYQQILNQHPQHADALHLCGLTFFQRGHISKSADLISRAIASDSTKPHYHFNLGLVREKAGELDHAQASYQEALRINPSYVEAQSNLGNILRRQSKLDEAAQAFESVLRIKPRSAEAHNNLGVVLKDQGKLEKAISHYRAALEINASHAEAHNNLGVALKEEGKLEEATNAFRQAITCNPQYANAHYHLGLTLVWQQQMEQALPSFTRSADLTHNHRQPIQAKTTTPARIKHDLEQVQYLEHHRIVQDLSPSYITTLKTIQQEITSQALSSGFIALSSDDTQRLAASYNSILHYGIADTLPGGTLNPQLDVATIEANYHEKQPEIMFLDHLLNEKALSSLRQYCLESTIWKRDYQNGYLGTFLAEGFACPLLLQIAEELRLRFRGIFKDHRLAQAWAFKYDSTLQGLNLHADAAAVNVNFWITPDHANLDPASGGLVVWDKEAPDEWDFKAYNNDNNQEKIRDFLKHQQAQPVTVPHRQNRALIFNSNLFHETDTLSFKDEYECRRINVTLLYGYRQQSHTRSKEK